MLLKLRYRQAGGETLNGYFEADRDQNAGKW